MSLLLWPVVQVSHSQLMLLCVQTFMYGQLFRLPTRFPTLLCVVSPLREQSCAKLRKETVDAFRRRHSLGIFVDSDETADVQAAGGQMSEKDLKQTRKKRLVPCPSPHPRATPRPAATETKESVGTRAARTCCGPSCSVCVRRLGSNGDSSWACALVETSPSC